MVVPTNLLEKTLNKKLTVSLKDGRRLEGKLIGFDDHMNLVLEETEETLEDKVRRLGTVILRGSNIVAIAPL